jgi:hypothetical protein
VGLWWDTVIFELKITKQTKDPNAYLILAGDCDLQVKLIRGTFWTHPEGVIKSVEEVWDGEIV